MTRCSQEKVSRDPISLENCFKTCDTLSLGFKCTTQKKLVRDKHLNECFPLDYVLDLFVEKNEFTQNISSFFAHQRSIICRIVP